MRSVSIIAMSLLVVASNLCAQPLKVGIVDLYGARRVTAADVRRALSFKEGDALQEGTPLLAESERRIAALPGVLAARVNVVCCDGRDLIVYVGVEEAGQRSAVAVRPSPTGSVRLPPEVLQAGDAFDAAFEAAMERGDFDEDQSQGHALMHDSAMRAIQEQFVGLADRHVAELREVLRNSSDAGQRALAAQVLGYVKDKQTVVDDLVQAMHDADEDVRNNAMRALWVFTRMTVASPPRVPFEPFIEMLNSPVWADRNKSSLALGQLSASRNPALLEALRTTALDSLIEMARWRHAGHAISAFLMLGRIAGLTDEAIQQAWDRGEREAVIAAVTRGRP